MTALFITVLNMSITASVVAIAVMLARVPLRRAPRIFSYVLWGAVLFRLVFPFSIESIFGFLPPGAAIPQDIVYSQAPAVQTGTPFFDAPANEAGGGAPPASLADGAAPVFGAPASEAGGGALSPADPAIGSAASLENLTGGAVPIHAILEIAGYIWLAGFIGLLLFAAASYIRLRRRVRYATLMRDNIFETDEIKTPFVLGFVRPKIYFPLGVCPEEQNFILKHEQHHIKRLDYLVKPFAFAALALHWFNPLMWVSYSLMSKDMEMSCDEAVLRETDGDIRRVYSSSLLNLAVKRMSLLNPLSFGESNVKERVVNVMKFKKTKAWVIVFSTIAVSLFLVSCLSDRVAPSFPDPGPETENRAAQARWEYIPDMSGYVALGQYKGLEAPVIPVVSVSEDEVNRLIEGLRYTLGTQVGESFEGTVARGDIVNLDIVFIGSNNGVPFEYESQYGFITMIGSGANFPELDEGLIGKNVGETVLIKLRSRYLGWTIDTAQEAEFFATINSIVKFSPIELNEFDDALFNNRGFGDVDDYIELTSQALSRVRWSEANINNRNFLLDKVVEASTILEYPGGELELIISDMNESFKQFVASVPEETWEGHLARLGATQGEIEARIEENARRQLAREMVLLAIAQQEGVLRAEMDNFPLEIIFERAMDFVVMNSVGGQIGSSLEGTWEQHHGLLNLPGYYQFVSQTIVFSGESVIMTTVVRYETDKIVSMGDEEIKALYADSIYEIEIAERGAGYVVVSMAAGGIFPLTYDETGIFLENSETADSFLRTSEDVILVNGAFFVRRHTT